MTLIDFLRDRIAEDELFARAAIDSGYGGPSRGLIPDNAWRFLVLNDPARVLAEVEAKRQIVASHTYSEDGTHVCADPEQPLGEELYVLGACPTLAALLSIYAEHGDFDEEWLQ